MHDTFDEKMKTFLKMKGINDLKNMINYQFVR